MVSIVVAAAVLVLDLLTKWMVTSGMTEFQEIPIIPGFFSLQFVHNPGAAFGMLAHQKWLFVAVSSAVAVGIVYFTRKPEAKVGVMPWALGFLLGGALGNLIDRIRYDKVVDYLLFYWRDYRFPNFNVADIAISVGVGLFFLHLILHGEKEAT